MTLFAVVPVKDLVGTKSRLAPVLNASARAGLTMYMMKNVLSALRGAGVERVCVVSPDRTVLEIAEEAGAATLLQESSGLNPALEEARHWAVERGASSLLVFPADLPLLKAPDVGVVLEAAERAEGPLAVVSPDAGRTGTNALLLRPADALPFAFGPNSFDAHLNAARERGLSIKVCEGTRLAFDLDTAEDLARFGDEPQSAPAKADSKAHKPPEELRVLPVGGIPEVRPGDDLADLIARAAGDELLEEGDVVVVTHKVVSKAEGRLVDLATVEPSVLAKSFAARYDKDPRQIEVVLRESKRVVRMDRGIVISETRHGFVCANAGVDVSNVPGDETVCLLPLDPDTSARRLRDSLSARAGVDLAVIISDSFGRTWRQGITNVAIGVAGMNPLADYRGEKDPHGQSLIASVLAVADELASAAELIMGKTAGIPVAVVRNYPYKIGPGTGQDLLMGPEKDLFR
ncbi:MAG: coenzyme F420-0:L-glutamate ligase [Rubrobacter sp.]|nr:coenzyme F420-0:L-glutamate ligase [Rubrobacter sp.]